MRSKPYVVTYQVWSPLHCRGGAAGCRPAVWLSLVSQGAKKGKPQPLAPLCRRCVWSPRCQQGKVPAGLRRGHPPPLRVLAPPEPVAAAGGRSPLDRAAWRGSLRNTLPWGGGLGSGGATSMVQLG